MGEKPSRCWYPILMILMCIQLVLKAAVSFRAAPKAVHLVLSHFQAVKTQKIPSYKTITRWLTRIGLYKLRRPKEQADDWTFIVDNSIQIGTQKCFVVLGIRMSKLESWPLTFEDVEVVLIELHDEGGQQAICQMIEKAQERVGKVVSVCADDGPDLRSGIDLFCAKYGVGRVYDTIHKMGTFLRKILEKDPEWQAFTSAVSKAKRKMQQTAAAHLVPPNQRTKSRFLNIDVLVRWAVDVMKALDDSRHPDKQLLEQYCGWIRRHKELIDRLHQLDVVSQHVRQHIRENGLGRSTGGLVEKLLYRVMASFSLNVEACQYAGMLIDFFVEQSKVVPPRQIWIGSSEVIESLFGKLKCLERNQCRGGFTSLVLGLSACTGRLDVKLVQEAMVQVKTKDVDAWAREQLGTTLLAKRRSALGRHRKKRPVKKIGQESTGIYLGEAA